MKRAVVISAGSIKDYSFYKDKIRDDDFIICADGGLTHAKNLNLTPNLIVGDFDSFLGEIPKNVEVIKLDYQKDFTDTNIAVDEALKRGFLNILLIGAAGTRLDHTLANIELLKRICDYGGHGEILCEKNQILICKDQLKIYGKGDTVSLLPMTDEVYGVTLWGFKYPLCDYTMKKGTPIGVSNVLLEDEGVIKIKAGLLLVIKSKD